MLPLHQKVRASALKKILHNFLQNSKGVGISAGQTDPDRPFCDLDDHLIEEQNSKDEYLYTKVTKSENIYSWISFLFLCETWSSRISSERERILDIVRDAWKGDIFLRDGVLEGV